MGLWFDDPRDLMLESVQQSGRLDTGIGCLMTLSTGEKIPDPKSFNKHRQRLRQAQKALSRNQNRSRNQAQARLKIARIHQPISHSRKDHWHKRTTRLIRENQTIAVVTFLSGCR